MMHFIDRSKVPAPPCLTRFKSGRDTWDALKYEDREQIRTKLAELTARRCAYCEANLDKRDQHIEHFQARGRAPALTFDWDNLFLSCDRQDSCGRHKDNAATGHKSEDLIKPDKEDPEEFLQFISDGSIRVRLGLNEHKKRRAEETLRVFNLDPCHGRLRKMRSLALKFYLEKVPGLLEFLIACSAKERDEFIRDELSKTSGDEFATAIKHFLQQTL